jgi:hypothetical protein
MRIFAMQKPGLSLLVNYWVNKNPFIEKRSHLNLSFFMEIIFVIAYSIKLDHTYLRKHFSELTQV